MAAPFRTLICGKCNCWLSSNYFLIKGVTVTQERNASSGSYYDVLEVSPKASQTQIKAAYYRLSKQYHPDVNNSSSAEKFANISSAYEVLRNPRNRRQYDSEVLGRRGGLPFHGSQVDIEYQEFMRHRGKFRDRRCTTTAAGRAPIFNFDEFYRQHYGESMRRAHVDKKMKDDVGRMKQEEEAMEFRSTVIAAYTVIMTVVFVALLKTMR